MKFQMKVLQESITNAIQIPFASLWDLKNRDKTRYMDGNITSKDGKAKDPAGIKRTIGLDTGKSWDSEDERRLARLSKKIDIQALAQIFKRTPTAIRYRLKLLKDQGLDVRITEYKGKEPSSKTTEDKAKE